MYNVSNTKFIKTKIPIRTSCYMRFSIINNNRNMFCYYFIYSRKKWILNSYWFF
ncbi:183L [Invertebrate iridescent virus 6]|uniref:183L n=1 Tax=Invertebrate iridescent virus 6 TaxID=176652 RepID=Q91FY2_IIV6|nr:183L [Invertebrate iridescent virus 6]AAK82050.1 183L [Invertebrate iridescent virus 6]QMS79559.1 hypothetical protein IIV6-T1_183 [Invertebrate iridescent virus 6]